MINATLARWKEERGQGIYRSLLVSVGPRICFVRFSRYFGEVKVRSIYSNNVYTSRQNAAHPAIMLAICHAMLPKTFETDFHRMSGPPEGTCGRPVP